ncbi:MAG: serine--tRNA ligase [Saprospirales bacterium]|nr:MAG: serine--tRNA ligase [Saprospirales bacterium]
MLEINYIKANREEVLKGLKKRNLSTEVLGYVDKIIMLDGKRRALIGKIEESKSEVNRLSKEIGELFRTGQAKTTESAEKAIAGKEMVTELKRMITGYEKKLSKIETSIQNHLYELPNVPNSLVPSGAGEDDNEVFKKVSGELPTPGGDGLPHWELGIKYKLFDFKLGTKITGSGFPVFTAKGAALQRALISFFLDKAIKAGYTEIIPPLLVNEATARGTGQLPDKEGQMYHAEKDNFYLIPTAEVPITNIYRDDIVNAAEMPIKMVGYTPCFRREAGSYGSDVKGLNRVHQFDKVEIVQIANPDNSYDQLTEMLSHVEGLLNDLNLPYRILRLCGGDLGFTSALTYDFEVWSAAQKKWLEVSSVSNFETFQSNRMKIRYREGTEKPRLVHTLNGSALALPRIMAAMLELNQTSEGIRVPEVLVPYTSFDLIQ